MYLGIPSFFLSRPVSFYFYAVLVAKVRRCRKESWWRNEDRSSARAPGCFFPWPRVSFAMRVRLKGTEERARRAVAYTACVHHFRTAQKVRIWCDVGKDIRNIWPFVSSRFWWMVARIKPEFAFSNISYPYFNITYYIAPLIYVYINILISRHFYIF